MASQDFQNQFLHLAYIQGLPPMPKETILTLNEIKTAFEANNIEYDDSEIQFSGIGITASILEDFINDQK